jgi:putative hydrolase of the HAD superfamily
MAARIKGVIFDLFHTLTGLESEWSDLPLTCDVLGIDRRAWDEVITQKSRWRLSGEQRDPFLIIRDMARLIRPEIADALVGEAVAIRIQRFRDALQRIPTQNVDMLKGLRKVGIRIGLVSNADAIEVAAWADCPLSGLFDSEVISCEVGMVKPEPEIFRKCLGELSLQAGDCMFVGDGGSNELVGAKEVGLTTVFVSGVIAELWPERIPARIASADHHLQWAHEVPGLLQL